MKVKFLKDLSDSERIAFEGSALYNNIRTNWLYTNTHIQYYQAYFSDYIYDNSFVIYSEQDFHLCVYSFTKESKQLAFFELPITFFYSSNMHNSNGVLLSDIFSILFAFIKEQRIKEIYCYHEPHITAHYFGHIKYNAMQYWSDIDLKNEEKNIRQNIRKSYKSLLNWGERELDCHIMDSSNSNRDIFMTFKAFHIKVSGRQTRSDKTWEEQYEAIKQNEAFSIFAYLNGKLVAANLIRTGVSGLTERTAYYGIGVYDRELMAKNKPISHYVLFKSILEAKERKCVFFELGDVTPTGDQKYNDILKFKRGFTNRIQIKNVIKLTLND